jgi:hypothetical protein
VKFAFKPGGGQGIFMGPDYSQPPDLSPSLPETISENYRALNRQLHESGDDWGNGDPAFNQLVIQFADQTNAMTVLDYGAGKATLAAAFPEEDIRSYDPAVPGMDAPPCQADLVVSRCVLEHVEPECLDAVLDHVRDLAKVGVLLVVNQALTEKTLPDGRPVHLIPRPMDWWLPRLMQRWSLESANLLPPNHFWFFGRTRVKGSDDSQNPTQ